MRRSAIAVFVVMLAAVPAAPVFAQTQDPVVNSARTQSRQGNHDAAITMLRGALASRPDDALRMALFDVLVAKQSDLLKVVNELNREIATLLPSVRTNAVAGVYPNARAGCGDTPAARPSAPVRVGGPIAQPIKVAHARPVYPLEAQDSKVEGIVIVEAVIDCEGNVADAKVLRGVPLLNDAAVESVRKWKYNPTLLNGVPVPVIMTVTVTFRLE